MILQIIRIVVLVVLLWSGWWLFAALTLRGALADWFGDRRAEGWQADYAAIGLSGFPGRIDLILRSPALADPATGVAIEAGSLRLTAAPWWPGKAGVIFPEDRILLATPEGRAALLLDRGRATVDLRPGSLLEVRSLGFSADGWMLEDAAGTALTAAATDLSMVQDGVDPGRYALHLNATDLAPGAVPRQQLRIPQDWPVSFEAFALDMQVQFDRPWDRRALEERRPQPQQINMDRAEVIWGALLLRAQADLGIDASGMPSGTVPLQARNWRAMLDLAVSAGTLPAGLRPQVETVLAALARAGGNPDSFEVTLTLEDGQIRVGFLPVAPAPLLGLR